MKKVILSAAALMFGSVLFAQNTSDAIQEGNNNMATINQTGGNTSNVDQRDLDNVATVTQDGENTSTVNQDLRGIPLQ
ncbi:hypothetical protein ACFSO9_15960 [Mesonia maritima]|uniref:hypothetical protein n=1 Tax=Mesonia maritima TaxID=1793873 RepID=UPI003636F2F8